MSSDNNLENKLKIIRQYLIDLENEILEKEKEYPEFKERYEKEYGSRMVTPTFKGNGNLLRSKQEIEEDFLNAKNQEDIRRVENKDEIDEQVHNFINNLIAIHGVSTDMLEFKGIMKALQNIRYMNLSNSESLSSKVYNIVKSNIDRINKQLKVFKLVVETRSFKQKSYAFFIEYKNESISAVRKYISLSHLEDALLMLEDDPNNNFSYYIKKERIEYAKDKITESEYDLIDKINAIEDYFSKSNNDYFKTKFMKYLKDKRAFKNLDRILNEIDREKRDSLNRNENLVNFVEDYGIDNLNKDIEGDLKLIGEFIKEMFFDKREVIFNKIINKDSTLHLNGVEIKINKIPKKDINNDDTEITWW